VKGQHTHAAVNKLQAFLSQDGWVLAMQNGLTEHRIAQTLGRERTIGAHINFAADYLEPGRIQYGGKGSMLAGALDVAGEPNAIQAVEMLRTAFPEARYTNELMGYKWSKVCLGAMLFVTAMSDEPMADQFDNTKLAPLWCAIAKEVLGVAQASGVHPQAFDGFDPDAFLNVQDGADAAAATSSIAHHCRSAWLAKPHSGIWRDLYVRRRPTEVDPQITDVVWHAEKLGMKAPLVGRLIVMIREIESGRRTSSPDNAIELMRMIEC
jgi:2-dehydropantoate 2-reductase